MAGKGKQGNDLVPKPAAQNPVYLLYQFRQFAKGRRKSPPYKSSRNSPPISLKRATEPGGLGLLRLYAPYKRGMLLFFKLCQHDNGMGNSGYANIAVQHSRYIAKTLTDFRDCRGNRNNSLMVSITHNLIDGELLELAAFIESLPPLVPEGGE